MLLSCSASMAVSYRGAGLDGSGAGPERGPGQGGRGAGQNLIVYRREPGASLMIESMALFQLLLPMPGERTASGACYRDFSQFFFRCAGACR